MRNLTKLALLIATSLAAINVEASITTKFPDSFELLCDRVFVVGRERRTISSSFLGWNKEKKSISIKSEMLDEYESSLTPENFEVYSAHKDVEDDEIIELTFKQRSTTNSWEDEESTQVVAIEVTRAVDASNAFLKVSDFHLKYGVVQNINTRHATCNVRNFEAKEARLPLPVR